MSSIPLLAMQNLQQASQVASRSSRGGCGASKATIDYRRQAMGRQAGRREVRNSNFDSRFRGNDPLHAQGRNKPHRSKSKGSKRRDQPLFAVVWRIQDSSLFRVSRFALRVCRAGRAGQVSGLKLEGRLRGRSSSHHYFFKSCFPAPILTRCKSLPDKYLVFTRSHQATKAGARLVCRKKRKNQKETGRGDPMAPFFRLLSFLSATIPQRSSW
jgi:hypothetical protein